MANEDWATLSMKLRPQTLESLRELAGEVPVGTFGRELLERSLQANALGGESDTTSDTKANPEVLFRLTMQKCEEILKERHPEVMVSSEERRKQADEARTAAAEKREEIKRLEEEKAEIPADLVEEAKRKRLEELGERINALLLEVKDLDRDCAWFQAQAKRVEEREKEQERELAKLLHAEGQVISAKLCQGIDQAIEELAGRCLSLRAFRTRLNEKFEELGGPTLRRTWWPYMFDQALTFSSLREVMGDPPRKDRANWKGSLATSWFSADGAEVKEPDAALIQEQKDQERQAKMEARRAESAERLAAAKEKFAQAAEKFHEENE